MRLISCIVVFILLAVTSASNTVRRDRQRHRPADVIGHVDGSPDAVSVAQQSTSIQDGRLSSMCTMDSKVSSQAAVQNCNNLTNVIIVLPSYRNVNPNHELQDGLWPLLTWLVNCTPTRVPKCHLGLNGPRTFLDDHPTLWGTLLLWDVFRAKCGDITRSAIAIRYDAISCFAFYDDERRTQGAGAPPAALPFDVGRSLRYGDDFKAEKDSTLAFLQAAVLANITAASLERAQMVVALASGQRGLGQAGRRKLCLYSKSDSNRALINADEVQAKLRSALPEFDVQLQNSLNMAFHDQAWWFYTCDVLLAPHGGWAANLMFMRNGSIAFTLPKTPYEVQASGNKTWELSQSSNYKTWDEPFDGNGRRIVFVNNKSSSSETRDPAEVKHLVEELLDWEGFDATLGLHVHPKIKLLSTSNIVARIREHFGTD